MHNNAEFSETLLMAVRLWRQVKEGTAIDAALAKLPKNTISNQRSAVQSLIYQTARNRALVQWLLRKLAQRAPGEPLASLLELALASAVSGKEKPFVLVNESVKAVKSVSSLKASASFVNAVLRRFYREEKELIARAKMDESVQTNAPKWWLDKYREIFKEEADQIIKVQREHPPLTLRVNCRKTTREDYLKKLQEMKQEALPVGLQGVVLQEATAVTRIPGFSEGEVSVQDAGSQLAAQILAPTDGMRVLDACAAPGGKTCHLLELAEIELIAVEKEPSRAQRINQNLERLGLKAKVVIEDIVNFAEGYKGAAFDRILLDAPCSASGIVRRHPEIPWIKDEKDIKELASAQRQILEKTWNILAKHGKILYSVCSVMPEEGITQIERFLAVTPNAKLCAFNGAPAGMLLLCPQQKKPDKEFIPWVSDGFFYALLEKV